MSCQAKIFTYNSGTGSTVIENTLQDRINEWLRGAKRQILFVTQSESEHGQTAHTTISIWYVPLEQEDRP